MGFTNDKIELLSPAGDYNCFLAALNAGADAVYLSGEKFGARAYAKNFSEEELIKAIDYAHIFNRKIYLTVNTLLKDEELDQLYDYLYPFYIAGLDGVIVQDLGVISYIRSVFPDMPVHVSTQLTITGIEGIEALENLGVKRVVLAREVSLAEIEYINNHSNMELETFVHGALCYSYSGKCLFSSLVGGRSGNRGRCAGSCRQPYNDNKYLLSTKDICCLKILPDLINAGIVSLKIEGRMKSPEYVAGVTSVYRKYIDLYYAESNKNNIVSNDELLHIKNTIFSGKEFDRDLNTLTSLYTRGGNSLGYYYKHNGKDMISLNDASYKSDKGKVKASINEEFIGNNLKLPITANVCIRPNEAISVLINDSIYVEGNTADYALNKPTDIDTVKKQLNKTNDTEFSFSEINCDIAEKAFVRISDLNELRRKAINEYRDYLLSSYRRTDNSTKAIFELEKENALFERKAFTPDAKKEKRLCCDVAELSQLNIAINTGLVKRVYVPYEVLKDNKNFILSNAKTNDVEVYLKFQSVIRYNFLLKNKESILDVLVSVDGVLADSHEVINFLTDNGFNKPIVGDIHIYALNRVAVRAYKDMGLSTLTVPIELSKKELYRRGIYGEELVVYGYLPMMISAQCVNKTINSCNKTHSEIKITDRTKATFTAVNDCVHCSNTIYNNVPLSLHTELDFINKIKPSGLRLIFTVENDTTTEKIVNFYSRLLNQMNGENVKSIFKENTYTKGHLNRGVL